MIDRISPTVRPAQKPAGWQKWRDLLFLHWPVPTAVLRPLVPKSLELDLHEGVAYVGVVPFKMEGVRTRWLPSPLAFTFLELNVRTYVYRENQPGVYFFSLDAASSLAVWAARQFWGLPYFRANMQLKPTGDSFLYESNRYGSNAHHRVKYRLGPPLGPSEPGTLEFFFLERYLLFVERQRQLYLGQVHHQPYPAQTAEVLELDSGLFESVGLPTESSRPPIAHFASGVDVEIFDLRRVCPSPK
ncbi:MAG: DUF2071 domain-containing protein [Pirellulaceae bacterium]|nr:DUF2071 domain-containing protein [Pirellulaceae bacterium]